jgi:hypothetical protein
MELQNRELNCSGCEGAVATHLRGDKVAWDHPDPWTASMVCPS